MPVARAQRFVRERSIVASFAAALLAVAGCQCGDRLQGLEGVGKVDPDHLDFGTVALGQSTKKTFNLQNNGAAALKVTGATFGGANASDFTLPEPIEGKAISPGQTMTVTVQFAPRDAGARAGNLALITDSKSHSALAVALAGNGIDIRLCPKAAALDFGSVQVKGTPVTQQLVIDNCGKSPADVSLSPVEGAQAGDFTLGGATSGTLQPGQSLSVTVAYSPGKVGPSAADVPYKACAACQTSAPITFSGVGIDGTLTLTPSPADVGTVPFGGSGNTTVTATNPGTASITINSLAIRGAGSPFTLSGAPALPAKLGPGQTLGLTVVFTPTAGGPAADDLDASFTLDDPAIAARNASDHLTATGSLTPCTLAVTPNPLDLGSVMVGTSATKSATLANSGQQSCNLTGIALGAGTDPYFTLANPAQTTLTIAPGANATIGVTFAPTAGGIAKRTGTLVFQSDDPAMANGSLPLTATVVSPAPCGISLSPASLGFGLVAPSIVAKRVLTITNSGAVACSISGIAMGAGTDPYFALTSPGTTSLSIAPGGNATISVNFAPTSAASPAARSGTLVFQSTDPSHPTSSVPLTATINVSVYSGGWPKWHFDNFNTGQTGADTSWLAGTVAWKFNVGVPSFATFLQSPVIDSNGIIYFLNMSGLFYAIRPNGTQAWTTQLSDPSMDPHPSTPVVLANGNLCIASGEEQATDPNLYLLSSTGSILSSITFGIEGFSATPGFGNSGILFEADDDGIPGNGNPDDPYDAIAFNVSGSSITQLKGKQIPFVIGSSSGERLSVVISQNDTSYWCSGIQCFALTPPTGSSGFSLVSAWPSAGVSFASPPLGAFSVTSDVAMDPRTGGYLYAYAGWGGYDASFNETVEGALVALDPANGAKKWTVSLPKTTMPTGWLSTNADYGNASPAVAADGTVYVGNGDGLRAVDGKLGTVKWHFTSKNVTGAPAIGADGTIFFGTQDGTFYALHPDGSVRFSVKAGKQIATAPAIASDGTVVFVSDDGFLYALK